MKFALQRVSVLPSWPTVDIDTNTRGFTLMAAGKVAGTLLERHLLAIRAAAAALH